MRAGYAASSARSDLGFAARFALGSLATWRLTHLLAEEDGPADLVLKARAKLGRSRAGELMDCVYCLSIWIAAPISLGVTRRQSELPFTWLGLSAATCLIERLTNSPIAGVRVGKVRAIFGMAGVRRRSTMAVLNDIRTSSLIEVPVAELVSLRDPRS